MGLIRNNNNNISVSRFNGYDKDKVRYAVEFLKTANRRTTPIQDYVDVYNYIFGTNEKIAGCQQCASARYISRVENYAKYGKVFLTHKGIDIYEEDKIEEAPIDESKDDEEIIVEVPKKRGRPKKNVEVED